MLLKSCATPPASLPIASIFCDSASRRSRARCSMLQAAVRGARSAIRRAATRHKQYRRQAELLPIAERRIWPAATLRSADDEATSHDSSAASKLRPRVDAAAPSVILEDHPCPARSTWLVRVGRPYATAARRRGRAGFQSSGVARPTTRLIARQFAQRRTKVNLARDY